MLVAPEQHEVGRHVQIEQVEAHMLQLPQVECPVVHHFGPGVYIREVTLPSGTLAVGHAQRFEHLNIMLSGSVAIIGDDGLPKVLKAPLIFVGKPGRKVGYIIETCVWQNVYPNTEEERSIDALEGKWLDKSATWQVHNELVTQLAEAAHQEDRDDFLNVITLAGFTPEVVRAQSENEDDQIPMPDNFLAGMSVRKSPIEGLGVFVNSHTPAGSIIAPARVDGKRTPAGRYTNHSRKPNARFVKDGCGNIWLAASRDIRGCAGGDQGEEVTVDYRQALSLSGILVEGEQS